MRVLQILPELNVGGVETGTVDFAKYLVEHGHHSVVVSNGGKLVGNVTKAGSKHYSMPVHKKSIFNIIRLIKPLREIIINEKVDIVHARSRVPAWIAFFACRNTNASFITTCHGHYGNPVFSRVMGWSKRVIVPSQVIGRHMIDKFGVEPSNIRPIPRGVDLSRFEGIQREHTGSAQSTIAIVGRITPLKGHDYFIRAMSKVVRSFPYAKIWIIGEAPKHKQAYKKDLEILVNRLGLKEHVEFLGNRSDVPHLLSQTDVLVMSSVEPESFGRVIVEAQAVGVPVVATRVGGVVDIIDHNRTGLLVMPKDTDAMATEVTRLLKDPVFGQKLTEAAQEKLKKEFTVERMSSMTLDVYDELIQSMNILVIKIGAVGDVVLITAALKAIRKKFPKAHITCFVGKVSHRLLQTCPYIDETIVYDPHHRDKGLLKFLKIARRLGKEHFDKVIDFQNNKKSHLLAFLAFPRESYGYNNGKFGFLLSHPVKVNRKDIPPVKHQFEVLKLLEIRMPENPRLELWLNDRDKKHVNALFEGEWLSNAKVIVGLNLAASSKWPTKNWPIEYYAKVCDALSAKNIRVVVTGLKKDLPVAKKLQSLTRSKPALLVGKTEVSELAAVIKRCKVFITPDSAPLHIAAAMNVPTIVFFGPTDPRRHLPPSKRITVLRRDLTCSPCYSGHCRILTHACMQDIKPDEVLDKIDELIGVEV